MKTSFRVYQPCLSALRTVRPPAFYVLDELIMLITYVVADA